MDFNLSEELEMIRENVRKFVERELFPLEKQFCIDGSLPLEKRKELERKGRELGFWSLELPEEYGGAGLGAMGMTVIFEELYRSPLLFKFGGSPEPALYACNDAQKEKYFYPVIRGEKRSCYAFTEPNTGSDVAGIQTRAVKKGDKWVINGSKTFITGAGYSDFVILYASTSPGKGAKGISSFLVDLDSPGLTISKPIPTMGDGWAPYTLFFDNCEIPEENLLGELNHAFKGADEQLTHGRLFIAAFCLGIARRSLEMALAYSKERHTFGKPIASNQAIQWMLADSGRPIRNEAFVAKLYCGEMAQRVTDRALQIFGGMGYTRELPIQSFYRQARLWRIGHGTSEIHRMMIARNMLKG